MTPSVPLLFKVRATSESSPVAATLGVPPVAAFATVISLTAVETESKITNSSPAASATKPPSANLGAVRVLVVKVWAADTVTMSAPPTVPASAVKISIFAVPSRYKSCHSKRDVPKSRASSLDGTKSLSNLPVAVIVSLVAFPKSTSPLKTPAPVTVIADNVPTLVIPAWAAVVNVPAISPNVAFITVPENTSEVLVAAVKPVNTPAESS